MSLVVKQFPTESSTIRSNGNRRRSSLVDIRRLSFTRKRRIGFKHDSRSLEHTGTVQAFHFQVGKPIRTLSSGRICRESGIYVHVPSQTLLVEHGHSRGSIWYDSIPCSCISRVSYKKMSSVSLSKRGHISHQFNYKVSLKVISNLANGGEAKFHKLQFYVSTEQQATQFISFVRSVNRYTSIVHDMFVKFNIQTLSVRNSQIVTDRLLLRIKTKAGGTECNSIDEMPTEKDTFMEWMMKLISVYSVDIVQDFHAILHRMLAEPDRLTQPDLQIETQTDDMRSRTAAVNEPESPDSSVCTIFSEMEADASLQVNPDSCETGSNMKEKNLSYSLLSPAMPSEVHPLVQTSQNSSPKPGKSPQSPNLVASCHELQHIADPDSPGIGGGYEAHSVDRRSSDGQASTTTSTMGSLGSAPIEGIGEGHQADNSRKEARLDICPGQFTVENENIVDVVHDVSFLRSNELTGSAHSVMSRRWCEVIKGALVVTNWRMRFTPYQRGKPLDVPLAGARGIRIGQSTSKSCVVVATKQHNREYRFLFDRHGDDTLAFVQTFLAKYFPLKLGDLFCFASTPATPGPYDVMCEWTRQCNRGPFQDQLARHFTVFEDNYELSSTYPRAFVIPRATGREDLVQIAKFRSRNRIPVVTWANAMTGAVLSRSSQPRSGMSGHRCPQDEALVRLYAGSSGTTKPFCIVDARGVSATLGNTVMGKGSESSSNYDNAVVLFSGIANIHTMRGSFEKLCGLCRPGAVDAGEARWLSRVESTGWLSHVRKILVAGMNLAQVLHKDGNSCLVHCSDGWDRTSQLVTIAQIILDPFYRTMKGFAILIEKDWIAFGHQFADRLGLPHSKASAESRSPVFVQWLDVVYQILRQCPDGFEFNEQFLLDISMELFSGRYTTFLWNSEKQASEHQFSRSLWVDMLTPERQHRYLNDSFDESSSVIWPNGHPKFVVLWEKYHILAEPTHFR